MKDLSRALSIDRNEREKATYRILANGAVGPVGQHLGGVPKVARREAATNFGVVLAATDDGDVEPLEVLAKLSSDRKGAREGLEVESMLGARRELCATGRAEDSLFGTTSRTFDHLRLGSADAAKR